jgi:hypothetical protein
MSRTGVFALDVCARLTALLNDQIGVMTLHNAFDVRPLMAGDYYETCNVRCDPVIFGRSDLNSLDATFRRALTVEGQRLIDTVLLRAFFDPLIDRAKYFFIVRRSFREVHRNIPPSAKRIAAGSRPGRILVVQVYALTSSQSPSETLDLFLE